MTAPGLRGVQTGQGLLERVDVGYPLSVESLDAAGWVQTGEPEFYLDGRKIAREEAKAIIDAETAP